MSAKETKRNWSKGFNVNYMLSLSLTPIKTSFSTIYLFIPLQLTSRYNMLALMFSTAHGFVHQYLDDTDDQNVNMNSKYLIMIYVWYIVHCVRYTEYVYALMFSFPFLSVFFVCFCFAFISSMRRHNFEEPSFRFGY